MNTGPVEVGQGGGNNDQQVRAYLRTQECAPKARTQKKYLTLETYRASAPRMRSGLRGNQGRGAMANLRKLKGTSVKKKARAQSV